MKSVCKQVDLSHKERDYACRRVFDPSIGKIKFFRSSVSPFGAIRSVHAFLRLSRALWWIGVVGGKLVWTSFCDDFIPYSRPSLEATVVSFSDCWVGRLRRLATNVYPFHMLAKRLVLLFSKQAQPSWAYAICRYAIVKDRVILGLLQSC